MRLSIIIVTICLLLGSNPGKAQQTIILDNTTKEFIFQKDYLHILEDKENKWTIDDVAKKEFENRFVANKSTYPYNENIKSAYWIRFKVKNSSAGERKFILESFAPHTNQWDLYFFDENSYKCKRSGLDLFFYDREYVNKNLILDLPLKGSEERTFYVHVISMNHSSFDYRIKPLNYFFFYSVNEYYFLGMYYGIMLIMAVYNLLIFISLRERVYLYYVLYVFSGIFTSLADDGVGYQYVWIYSPHINSYVGAHIAPLLLLLTFVLYSYEFLHLKENYPFYTKLIAAATMFYFFYYILKETILPPILHFHGFYVLPFLLVYFVAWKVYFEGYKPARYFILGFGFILISIVIIKLRSNGSIEGNLFTVYSFNYGLVLEVLVLSLALAERVKYAKKEKEKALRQRNYAQYKAIKQLRINEELKDKVNKELEAKVTERTKELNDKNSELEITNGKLQEMTERAHQMSLKLDKDNWNLQKEVLNSIRDRLIGQEVSYEEFNKLFADEAACFRYLYELKWENSYECRRCHCKEAAAEEKLFAKKCGRCGYLESVTAHTLFHAVKFPINKAFYILYIMIYQQDRMTLNELSDLLELNRNTCWKFKQKVVLAMDHYYKKSKKGNTGDYTRIWEGVIFYHSNHLEVVRKK
jgi:two-component system, sensor histidine kinase LadS